MQCASSITSRPTDLGEQRQHLVAEAGVVEPLGADQQQVDRAGGEPVADDVPFVAIGAVDRVRPQPEALGGGDLVAHQRQQRADDQRRSGAGLAQQRGRDEVDRRLAPAGPLHAQHAGAVDDHVVDCLELVGAELRVRIAGQRPQAIQGARGDGVGVGDRHLTT